MHVKNWKVQKYFETTVHFLVFCLMNDAIEILSSCENQVCRLHRIWATYNLNSNSCCMLYYGAVLCVKN